MPSGVVVSKDFDVVLEVDVPKNSKNSIKSCRMGRKSVSKSLSYTGNLITCLAYQNYGCFTLCQ